MINPEETVKEYLKFFQSEHIENALDLGCGNGRISLNLVERGVNVLGIDINDIKIQKDNFSFIKKDVREFEFPEKYDLIISSLILHFFKREKSIEIINKMKKNTDKWGFNFLICLSGEDDCSKESPQNFYPNLNLLREIYSGWEIIKETQDFTGMENHGGTGEHRHNLIFMIVRNSESSTTF